ncbi:MAG: LamG domain-containing protein [Patescibacteria group bacterium]|nr:LamG domain-containing protein [Patescibacteria group bacterium]MDD5121349.1 LamG domain-containing protein [Patescibacteria group bacterium]MDD5395732.1 LamG domain-containing protein [Patescibacteria group bacterium]
MSKSKKILLAVCSIILLVLIMMLIQTFTSTRVLSFLDPMNRFVFDGWLTKLFSARGGSTHNIRGWLWSENYGWLNTNCYNDYNNDGTFDCCCPDAGYCPAEAGACPYSVASNDYGLNVDLGATATNKLNGYAYMANLGSAGDLTATRDGYVCFGETCGGTAPDGFSTWACIGSRLSNGSCLGDCGEDFNYNSSCTDSTPDPDLVAQWKFNEIDTRNGTTPSSVGTGLNATLGPTYPTFSPFLITGKFNSALDFDVDNNPLAPDAVWAQVQSSSPLNLTSNFTLEGWINLKGDTGAEQIMLRKADAYALGVIPATYDNFQAKLYIDGTWNAYNFSDSEVRVNYQDKWRHVAMTYDGAYVRLYLDGALDRVYAQSGSVNIATTSPLYLGGEQTGAHLSGYLDDVVIYNRVKTAQELWQDAKQEVTGWARVRASGSSDGWVGLSGVVNNYQTDIYNNNGQVSEPGVDDYAWGLFLNDHSQGGGYYTFGGWYSPSGHYDWRTWSWNSNYFGWITGSHVFSGASPKAFDTFSAAPITNLSCDGGGYASMNLTWEASEGATSYIFWRCPAHATLDECLGGYDYSPYSISKDACTNDECQTIDDWYLEPNTRYCYKMQAWNNNGNRWATDTLPNHPQPFCVKTVPCSLVEDVMVQGNTCGQLKLFWAPTADERNNIDGYNIYRSVRSNGCDSLTGSNCIIVGHLGEGLPGGENLVGQWKMNETSWSGQGAAKDSSYYNNDATANGSPYPTTEGAKFNRSGYFDGGHLAVADSDSLDVNLTTESFTISAWVKTTDTDGMVIEKISGNNGYQLSIVSGKAKCFISDGTNQAQVTGTTTVNDNNWHYLACVASHGVNLKLFVDKNFEGTPADISLVGDTSNTASFNMAGTSVLLSAMLDNVSAYKEVRSHTSLLVESLSNSLSASCQLTTNQPFLYGASQTEFACTEQNPCCQFVDSRVNPNTIYYYSLTQTSGAGESSAKGPRDTTSCKTVNAEWYRYGCDKTTCQARVQEKER